MQLFKKNEYVCVFNLTFHDFFLLKVRETESTLLTLKSLKYINNRLLKFTNKPEVISRNQRTTASLKTKLVKK